MLGFIFSESICLLTQTIKNSPVKKQHMKQIFFKQSWIFGGRVETHISSPVPTRLTVKVANATTSPGHQMNWKIHNVKLTPTTSTTINPLWTGNIIESTTENTVRLTNLYHTTQLNLRTSGAHACHSWIQVTVPPLKWQCCCFSLAHEIRTKKK